MKFSVMVEGFMKAIDAAASAATKSSLKDFPEGERMTISATKENMVVSAFGGRLGIKTVVSNDSFVNLNYQHTNDGKVTVNAKDLVRVLESFIPEETVILKTKKNSKDNNIVNELYVMMSDDEEQYQTLPCYDSDVNLPEKASNFVKTIEMDKNTLIYGISKVMFAAGQEQTKPLYLNMSLATAVDSIKFSAGTGSRHAILSVDGKNIVKSTPKKASILIPKDTLGILTHILSNAVSETVFVKESNKKDGAPFQVVIESGEQEIMLVGLDSSLKWVDESKLLNAKYPNRMITRISDWAYASKGTFATFDHKLKKEGKVHKAYLNVDLTKNHIVVKTNEAMRSSRKIPIIDHEFEDDGECDYICVSSYLHEMTSIAKEDGGFIQIELIGATKPIVVYYHAGKELVDSDDIKKEDDGVGFSEKLIIFFGTHTS